MTQRPIKFRQRIDNQFHYWGLTDGVFIGPVSSGSGETPATSTHDEFTGLHDKTERLAEVYEGDIVSSDGKLIGNRYENETLLQDPTNLLIEGLGTAAWAETEKAGLGRGLTYSKRNAPSNEVRKLD
jgi:hypothetical protein